MELTENKDKNTVTVKLTSFLRDYMKEKGLPYAYEIVVRPEGRTAFDIAGDLSVPVEKIEGVFINGLIRNIYEKVFPGDRVAFIPPGTPGPYRVLLGIKKEIDERERREKSLKKNKY